MPVPLRTHPSNDGERRTIKISGSPVPRDRGDPSAANLEATQSMLDLGILVASALDQA